MLHMMTPNPNVCHSNLPSTLCSYTEDREVYYFNVRTGESIWDHPMDAYYKALFRQEKIKLEKKRKKMVCRVQIHVDG